MKNPPSKIWKKLGCPVDDAPPERVFERVLSNRLALLYILTPTFAFCNTIWNQRTKFEVLHKTAAEDLLKMTKSERRL